MDKLDIIKEISEFENNLTTAILSKNGDETKLSYLISKIADSIISDFGIPEDNTVELCNEYGVQSLTDLPSDVLKEEMYCRDSDSDIIYEYCDGKETKEKVIKFLEKSAEIAKTL